MECKKIMNAQRIDNDVDPFSDPTTAEYSALINGAIAGCGVLALCFVRRGIFVFKWQKIMRS